MQAGTIRIPRLTVLVHICYTLTGTLYLPHGAPPAGSKPRPAEKPGKPENTYRQQYTSPRGTSGSNPSTESSNKQHKKNTDKYANSMQGIKATTKSREPKDRNNSSTARSDQRNNQFVATGILSTWELPTHLQYTIPDANNQLHLLLLTHEMWELPTPLIAANKPSRENEVRELPAQPPRYTGTTRSSLNIASWYSQFNRTGIASKTGLDSNMRVCNATADIITQAQTQTTQKQEKKYEVKPQYEELSKQLIMQHAIIDAMKCMRAIKGRIARTVNQLANHLIRASIPRTVYKPGKSSVRDLQSPPAHHSSVVFRHNQTVGHHSDDSVGLFRHDTFVGQSQRGSKSDFTTSITAMFTLKTAKSAQFVPSTADSTSTDLSQGTKTHGLGYQLSPGFLNHGRILPGAEIC
ncbi:EGF domain-specific O-linked N-acetylglucosamine transferase-like [Dorcoceras hygrometricum]|uniref:EGF domain-specific O-linked N-acetylglucosamine transferase-like n=1 Tax=Dorcoceras hygrometricum TaxID=472368 RepID=A0A2Z7AAG9_9LAMI|nr:EGF domain-specific O-linked N-acetylglucosamine transferase-like [Dorcoceras hygrometricum]